jgi:hypothetical protein
MTLKTILSVLYIDPIEYYSFAGLKRTRRGHRESELWQIGWRLWAGRSCRCVLSHDPHHQQEGYRAVPDRPSQVRLACPTNSRRDCIHENPRSSGIRKAKPPTRSNSRTSTKASIR